MGVVVFVDLGDGVVEEGCGFCRVRWEVEVRLQFFEYVWEREMRGRCDGQPARVWIASGVYGGEILGNMIRPGNSDADLEERRKMNENVRRLVQELDRKEDNGLASC